MCFRDRRVPDVPQPLLFPPAHSAALGSCCPLGNSSLLQIRDTRPLPHGGQTWILRVVNMTIFQFCIQGCCSFIHSTYVN